MGEIFMQNCGTLFHSSQFKPDVVQHGPVFFLVFPYTGSCISPIKISRHFNTFRQSYAEWDYRLPNSGCRQVVKDLKEVAYGGEAAIPFATQTLFTPRHISSALT